MSLELDTLLAELDRIDGCGRTKAKVRRLLVTMAGQRVYFAKAALLRPLDVALVRGLAAAGLDGAALRDAAMERLGVSAGTAYRLIRAARRPDAPRNYDLFKPQEDGDGRRIGTP